MGGREFLPDLTSFELRIEYEDIHVGDLGLMGMRTDIMKNASKKLPCSSSKRQLGVQSAVALEFFLAVDSNVARRSAVGSFGVSQG